MNIASRSLCERAKVGAVIADTSNRIVSTGYNGPPAGFRHENAPCTRWCARAMKSAAQPGRMLTDPMVTMDTVQLATRIGDSELAEDYSDCPALHAEANALLSADRSEWYRGTIYVLGDICFSCAKLIANSGLSTVVVEQDGEDRSHRNPERSYSFLRACGLTVYGMKE